MNSKTAASTATHAERTELMSRGTGKLLGSGRASGPRYLLFTGIDALREDSSTMYWSAVLLHASKTWVISQ